VVKQVDAAELRVVAVAVLAFAADAVLVARHFLKLRAHLLTALTRLHVHDFAQIRSLEVGSTREKKDGEERRNLLISAWQFVYPERESEKCAGCGRARLLYIFFAAFSLLFAKAGRAATLPQQEKTNSEDLQRGRVNTTGFI
jgi:hypothetical protein